MPILKGSRGQFEHLMCTVQVSDNQHYSYPCCHEKQGCTHQRIYISYDLVNRKKSGKYIIGKDNIQPDLLVHPAERSQKVCRAGHKRDTDCQKEERNDYIHHRPHCLPQILTYDVRHVSTAASDRHHSREEIVGCPHKDASYHNPEICGRAIGRSHYSTENRSQSGYIEKLNDKNLPSRHRFIIHTILHCICRSLY